MCESSFRQGLESRSFQLLHTWSRSHPQNDAKEQELYIRRPNKRKLEIRITHHILLYRLEPGGECEQQSTFSKFMIYGNNAMAFDPTELKEKNN